VAAAVELDRPGFYPVGGGAATLSVWPSAPDPPDLTDRGGFEGARVYSTAATALADADVARRQADAAADVLDRAGLDPVERVTRIADADCPGSSVCVRLDYAGGVAGFDRLGERGTPAEDVGSAAADAAVDFDEGAGAVDSHLGDQLVVVLALVGGQVRFPAVTDHVRTAVDLVDSFGLAIELRDGDRGALLSA
jgi:RNA 3'-terminal phosphate cyclase (ATP)